MERKHAASEIVLREPEGPRGALGERPHRRRCQLRSALRGKAALMVSCHRSGCKGPMPGEDGGGQDVGGTRGRSSRGRGYHCSLWIWARVPISRHDLILSIYFILFPGSASFSFLVFFLQFVQRIQARNIFLALLQLQVWLGAHLFVCYLVLK